MIGFALRELRNQKRLSLLFVVSLGIGLSAFVSVDTFRLGLDRSLAVRSKGILGADIAIGARRPLTQIEIQKAEEALPGLVGSAEMVETFTMLAAGEHSRLAEVRAVEPGYPFYGALGLKNQGRVTKTATTDLYTDANVWMYPELLLQLGLQIGDRVQIGKMSFVVSDAVLDDSAGIGAGTSFAPPVYMSLENLRHSGLLQKGSTAHYSKLFQLKEEPATEDAAIEQVAETLDGLYADPAIRVTTHKNASEQVGRLIDRLSDYLGLASLVALFLTALGCAYLYRSYLNERFHDIAVYKSLGLKSYQVEVLYLVHVFILATLAFIPLVLTMWMIVPFLSDMASRLLEVPLQVRFEPRTWVVAFLALFVGSALLTYPQIRWTRNVQPRALLSNTAAPAARSRDVLLYLPFFILFCLLSVGLSGSWHIGALFMGGLAASVLFFLAMGRAFLWICKHFENNRRLVIRWITRSCLRHGRSFYAAFTALAVASLLSQFLPQLESSLLHEIAPPDAANSIPSLFLFDVQPEQVKNLTTWLQEKNLTPQTSSAMIRARLQTVNGEPFTKAKREDENRSRNRGYNLTYRMRLSPSETLVRGKMWDGPYEDLQDDSQETLPEISLETRFADRVGLKMGDILDFDIQGISVSGRVTSLRHVRWTSFQPNFFILFQPGVLDEAPFTQLMTIPHLPRTEAALLQTELVQDFPNVSILDVSRLVDRISELIRQMSLALKGMAALALFVSLLVFYAIVSRHAFEKRKHVNLLKVLGCPRSLILWTSLGEFFLTMTLATVAGTLGALTLTSVITWRVFDGVFTPNPLQITLTAVTFLGVGCLVSYLALSRVLAADPQELLKESP